MIPSVGALRGGPSVMIRMMAQGLVGAGVDVHVATTDDNGHARLDVPHGVPVVERGVTYWYFRRQTRFYTCSWPLGRWLARHVAEYDLAHVHALFSYSAIPVAYWAGRCGVPYVVRPLGTLNRWGLEHRRPWLKKLSLRLIERRILTRAAVTHYTSEQERMEAMELGVNGRSAVVPLGVDLRPFEALPARGWLARRAPRLAGRTVALFLSRLDPKKGLDLLLRSFAVAKARRPDLALVVAGSGEVGFEGRLRREAADLGLGGDVFWAGFLDGREKLNAFADADLFVLPSYSENFGIAAVEAMACGLPVVISDRVGIHREVAAAGAGLVAPCEIEPVADALLRLGADAGLRRQVGARGRQLVRAHFSVEAMTAGLIWMYGDIRRLPATASRPGRPDAVRAS